MAGLKKSSATVFNPRHLTGSLCVYFLQNLRNEEQVAVIQAGTVLSLCEKVSARPLSKPRMVWS